MRPPGPPVKPRPAESRSASFRHAFAGWAFLFRTTPNVWIHLFFTVFVIVLGVWLRVGWLSWAVLALAIGLVWVAEVVNTSIEAVVDLASPEHHRLAKIGKDVAAAAVLTAAGFAVVVGLLVLGPPLLERLLLLLS